MLCPYRARFDTGFCSEGEHKVRPYIGFVHWFEFGFGLRQTCSHNLYIRPLSTLFIIEVKYRFDHRLTFPKNKTEQILDLSLQKKLILITWAVIFAFHPDHHAREQK